MYRLKKLLVKIRELWTNDKIHGVELLFDIGLVALRFISISYLLKDDCLPWFLNKIGVSDVRRCRIHRDNLVDCYCLLQLVLLLALLYQSYWPTLCVFLALYVVFEIYLNLFSIFFLPRQEKIGIPNLSDRGALNEPSTRAERSILLLLVNALQIILAFAVLYRESIPNLAPFDAIRQAVLVFGTLGAPRSFHPTLVALQVSLDFLLVVMALGAVVGRIGGFAQEPDSD